MSVAPSRSPKRVAVLGSTGTIGRLALEVISCFPERFEVVALTAGNRWETLAEQAARHRPRRVSLQTAEASEALRQALGPAARGIAIDSGAEGNLRAVTGEEEPEIVVNALVGAAGLLPSVATLERGARLALANKESLVVAGELLARASEAGGGSIVPIDSEHSGLWQCLEGRDRAAVRRVVLTASGGPFRALPLERIENASPEEALRHPTWRMGRRITIDSATLLNKGFEVLEAHWLFRLPVERIGVWIHPQSLVHALVEWADGSTLAQLSTADMRLPIQAALLHPERVPGPVAPCDLAARGPLEFHEVDEARYPCFPLAKEALARGGTAPAVLNAADEVLVEEFLAGRISFGSIARLLRAVVEEHEPASAARIEAIVAADAWARLRARELAERAPRRA